MAILAFDAGGSSVKYAAIQEDGTIMARGSFVTPAGLDGFYAGLRQVKQEMSVKYELHGAAFSLPGAVNDKKGIIGGASAIPYIHDFPFKKGLEACLKLPVAMENDANCAALGEVWQGAARNCCDVAFLVIGSGVGGALIKNGKIHHGAHLHGGEFCYMVMDNTGTILSEAGSTRGMVRYYEELAHLPADSMNGRQVFARADAGEEKARQAVQSMIHALACAIYNIQYAYDPECVVIGGGISARADIVPLLDAAVGKILSHVRIARVRPDIRQACFGNDANLIGAVRHFLQQQD